LALFFSVSFILEPPIDIAAALIFPPTLFFTLICLRTRAGTIAEVVPWWRSPRRSTS
jgi:hypothetical protein